MSTTQKNKNDTHPQKQRDRPTYTYLVHPSGYTYIANINYLLLIITQGAVTTKILFLSNSFTE